MTPRVRAILETRWIAAGKPEEDWVWPARTRSGHLEPNGIYGQHLKTLEAISRLGGHNSGHTELKQ
jgi:hypothetical protein